MKTSGFNVNGFLLMENFIQSIFFLKPVSNGRLAPEKKIF
jgi:hypothetical protein